MMMVMNPHTYLLSVTTVVLMSAIVTEADETELPSYSFCKPEQRQTLNLHPQNGTFSLRKPPSRVSLIKLKSCSIALRTGPLPVVLSYTFKFFRTRIDLCNNKYMCLGGIHHCGMWSPNVTYRRIVPENSVLTIVLNPYWPPPQYPMEVVFLPENVNTSQPVMEPFGEGSNQSSIYYKELTYFPGMNYTDACAVSPEAIPIVTTVQPTTITHPSAESTRTHTNTTVHPTTHSKTNTTATQTHTTVTHPVTTPTQKPTKESISPTDGLTSTTALLDFMVKCTCQCECPEVNEPCSHNETLFESDDPKPTFTTRKK